MSTNSQRRATPRDTRTRGTRLQTVSSSRHPAGQLGRARVGASNTRQRVLPSTHVPPGKTQAATNLGTKRTGMRRYERKDRQRRGTLLLKVGATLVAGVALLAVVFVANNRGAAAVRPGQAGQYRFDVASPAAGARAPDFTLPATTGGTVRLSAFRGKSVLLYFQEGIGCEGCWTQMQDIQTQMKDFRSLGIETMLTVTTNPLDALKQKVADEGITLPVLSDASFAVSHAYNATAYGMMAGSTDGHTFILVGPDGRIRWRADYGGPPDYTMYVPVSNLLADIKAGMDV